MGFLDNTTNNIILDAVLTDTGRQFLARNDGSFSIFKFGLGDDEVNYGNITKYGRTVGTEKIVKNTPVFEASTDSGFALRHNLLSLSNPNLVYVPTVKLNGNVTSFSLSVNNVSQRSQTVIASQDNGTGGVIDVELQDVMYLITMNNLFLEMVNGSNNLSFVDSQQRATYRMPPIENRTSSNGTQLKFDIAPKSLTTQMFSVYGTNNVITTYVSVKGMQSGAVLEFPVYINLN